MKSSLFTCLWFPWLPREGFETIALALQKVGRCAWIRVVNKVLCMIDVQEGDNKTVSSNLWICGNCQKWVPYEWQALECVGVSGVCIIASRC